MKLIATFIFALFTLSTFGQKPTYKVYKIIDHKNFFGVRTTFDTIRENTITDISFFHTHFYYPQSLPASLKNSRYKNQTVVEWAKGDTVKDSMRKANWSTTYKYDDLSRVTAFAYSGCMLCNSLPYNYTLTYNTEGWVDNITKTQWDATAVKSSMMHWETLPGLNIIPVWG